MFVVTKEHSVESTECHVCLFSAVQPQQLDFTFDPSKQLLTIRKPGINIAEDFVISFQ